VVRELGNMAAKLCLESLPCWRYDACEDVIEEVW
jgi:hypothetical protein